MNSRWRTGRAYAPQLFGKDELFTPLKEQTMEQMDKWSRVTSRLWIENHPSSITIFPSGHKRHISTIVRERRGHHPHDWKRPKGWREELRIKRLSLFLLLFFFSTFSYTLPWFLYLHIFYVSYLLIHNSYDVLFFGNNDSTAWKGNQKKKKNFKTKKNNNEHKKNI